MLKVDSIRSAILSLFVLLSLNSISAGFIADDNHAGERVVARRIEKGPLLDGVILGEQIWTLVQPASSFWQTTPDEGQPSTQRTEVRILYNKDTLYVGVICFDEDPAQIIISDSRRDASLDETDSFRLILDTFHDHQNGFVFGTNPAGIEYDAQVTNEGEGGGGTSRQSSGSGAGFNINWDGSWEVHTSISEIGWSAEFSIPFRTLRYPGVKKQSWGLNLQRDIRRRKERSFWTPLSRQYDITKLSEAGLLDGLEIPDRRNLKITPYLLGQADKNVADNLDTDIESDLGADIKYSITPGLTLDLTYNTDFAQVEVDEQQVNLDRFNLFFPEKRPFFLENAGIFAVGDPGDVEMFFSRRIGIGPNGQAVPIVGGARLSGKLGKTRLGLLNMQTESVGDTIPAGNFGVVRISQEFPNRSSLGGILVNRQGTGSLAPANDYNRSAAVDGRLGIGRYTQLSGFAARTWTPELTASQHAFGFGAEYESEGWQLSANYTEVGDNFNPEVGFLRRSGYRKPDFLVFHSYRPENLIGLQEIRPHISYRGFWNFSGFQETGFLHMDSHWEWKNGYEIHTGINFTTEGVTEPFEISDGVFVEEGSYHHSEVQIVAFTNRGAPLSFNTTITAGGIFGGNRFSLDNTLHWRVGETLNSEISWNRDDIDLPWGDFIVNLVRARISYSFSPRTFIQTLIQFNNQSNLFSANFRLTWLQTANTGLFIVYNQASNYNDLDLSTRNRTFVIKYSRLFDVFR